MAHDDVHRVGQQEVDPADQSRANGKQHENGDEGADGFGTRGPVHFWSAQFGESGLGYINYILYVICIIVIQFDMHSNYTL